MPEQPCRIYAPCGEVFALVDAGDYAWAAQWRWSLKWSRGGGKAYLRRVGHEGARAFRVQRTIWLHRTIVIERMGILPPTVEHTMIDHEDGDEMNCQRYNLRWATPKMNRANTRISGSAMKRRLGLC